MLADEAVDSVDEAVDRIQQWTSTLTILDLFKVVDQEIDLKSVNRFCS